MNKNKILLLILIAAAVAAFFGLGLQRYVSLDYFQSQRAVIEAEVAAHPLRAGLLFFAAYVAVTGRCDWK